MSLFKCKMCGGSLEVAAGTTVIECEYCGTKQTLPKLDDDKRANMYDRANHFRRNNEFDKAMGIYENILNEDNTDAEAYWSLVLCRYGIEYVEDPASHKRIPTVNRAQFTSIFDDDNYKSALQYADSYQRAIYESEAKAINEIQKGILAISQKEEPFDVFICYKESDNNGRRTPDSVLAQDLYYGLKNEGFKVFFARITLEDKLGSAYEPYIFAALNSAKVMVVLGTRPEFFNAVWVKNEWSRYLALIKQGQKKMLIPAYKDMDPYDLPEEFSHLQAQDMSKLGFMQDLIRGIKKIAKSDEPKTTVVKETVVTSTNTHVAPLLKRAFMFLEDGNWERADDFCEQVLNQDPENAQAYLGKLMAELNLEHTGQLESYAKEFNNNANFVKALRFADAKYKEELLGYVEGRNLHFYNSAKSIVESGEDDDENKYFGAARVLQAIPNYKDVPELIVEYNEKGNEIKTLKHFVARYNALIEQTASYNTSALLRNAANLFMTIKEYEPARLRAEELFKKAEEAAEAEKIEAAERAETERKNTIYNNAVRNMKSVRISEVEYAIKEFESIIDWKDSAHKIGECREALEPLRRKVELDKIEREKRKKRNKIIGIIVAIVIVAIIACIIVFSSIAKSNKYNDAIALMNQGKYNQAITAFEELENYKDSKKKIDECKIKKYNSAIALMNEGKYSEAQALFIELDDYLDSADKVLKCDYNKAITLMNESKYSEARTIFISLGNYLDSAEKIKKIEINLLKSAKVGDYAFFGAYEQDNNTSNGKEAVEWLVLEVKGGKALVISKYALDCKPYDTRYTDVTWETCTLRKWLNNDFINATFSADEKAMIPTVTISADSISAGNSTRDQVFLLSITEVNRYFSSYSARQCEPTAYAVANEAYANSSNGNCWWWLRSPGRYLDYAACVHSDGDVRELGTYVYSSGNAVRPAMWIDLNS